MICSIITVPYKYNYCILFKGLPYMYVTINYNMYTICIRNTARSKSIPLLCTHVYSYMFSTVHPPREITHSLEDGLACYVDSFERSEP